MAESLKHFVLRSEARKLFRSFAKTARRLPTRCVCVRARARARVLVVWSCVHLIWHSFSCALEVAAVSHSRLARESRNEYSEVMAIVRQEFSRHQSETDLVVIEDALMYGHVQLKSLQDSVHNMVGGVVTR